MVVGYVGAEHALHRYATHTHSPSILADTHLHDGITMYVKWLRFSGLAHGGDRWVVVGLCDRACDEVQKRLQRFGQNTSSSVSSM